MQFDKKVLILLFMILGCSYWAVNGQEPLYPRYSLTQTLVSSADYDSSNYLAFPSILRLNDDEILISFKRGAKHGGDGQAAQEMIHFNVINYKGTNGEHPDIIRHEIIWDDVK